MKRSLLIGLGLIVFLWTLLSQAPAARLYGWVAPHLDDIKLYGVDGTLFNGELSGFDIGGRQIDEQLHWRLRPLWLLLGRVAADVDGSGQLSVNGEIQAGLGGLRLRSFTASGDAKAIASLVGFALAPVGGNVQLDLATLRIHNGLPVAVDGNAELHQLVWAMGPNPMPLGDFRAVASTQGDSIQVKINSLAGPLDTNGTVGLTPASRSYQSDLSIHPKGNIDPMLRNMLQATGRPDPSGAYHLRRNGTF